MRQLVLLFLTAYVYSNVNLAYPTGAPEESTGAAGETDCSTCHFGELGNTTPQLTVKGLDNVVRAGSHQFITLQLSHPDMQVAGIQVTIRSIGDSPELAGKLISRQLKTFVTNGVAYLNHANPLQSDSGIVEVVLEWDVPETSEAAIFNVAMVAANDDLSPFGDSVIKIERIINITTE